MLLDINQGEISVNLTNHVSDFAFYSGNPQSCRLKLNLLQITVPFFHTF